MAFCLLQKYADKFKEGIKSGEISPDKLVNMSSEERRTYLSKFIGEFNAKEANTLFESKLLLKNQQAGLIRWAKKLGGISEESRKDIIAKIEKLDKALDTKSEKTFLADIVESRIGVSVSITDAQTITTLANKAKSLYDPKLKDWEQPKEYWQTRQTLNKYIRDITPENLPLSGMEKAKSIGESALSVERAIKTGFDLSAPMRQGRALFGTKEWIQAFKNMFSYAKSQSAFDDLEVKMLSNRYSEYAIKNKRELGLTLLGEKFTQREEEFGSKLIDKIPLLKGSERAYVGFLNDIRFNRFVNILDNLEKSGVSILDNKEAQKDLAKVIGASTGRGTLGGLEQSANTLATVLFSPRWISSRVQTILNPLTKTGVARTEAIKSFARLAGTSVAVLGMAKMAGADVETDPRSSDFGKIKVGKTRFDVTGGMGAYITLIAKGIEGSTKSSTSGKITKLNTGKYGSQTYMDVLINFVLGKTSPVASVIKDIFKGETFGGEKVKVGFTKDFSEYLGQQLFQPLLSSDAISAFQEGMGTGIAGTGASIFGIGVNTYK